MEAQLKTVRLSVISREEVSHRAIDAFSGGAPGAHISFASVDLLWQTLTRKRWDLLRGMAGKGSMSIREAARLVDRDVKAVHRDIKALVAAGVVDQDAQGVAFPYDAVHVDFKLEAAA